MHPRKIKNASRGEKTARLFKNLRCCHGVLFRHSYTHRGVIEKKNLTDTRTNASATLLERASQLIAGTSHPSVARCFFFPPLISPSLEILNTACCCFVSFSPQARRSKQAARTFTFFFPSLYATRAEDSILECNIKRGAPDGSAAPHRKGYARSRQ